MGRDFFAKRGMNVVLDIIGLHDQPSFSDIKDFTNKAVGMFADGTLMNCIFITVIMSMRLNMM